MEETIVESPYCMDLDSVSRQKYQQFVNKYVGRDPFLMKMNEFSSEPKDLLTIEAVYIQNYLVLQTSYYTKQQMKVHKSLEAYNFGSGWVHSLYTQSLHNYYCLVFNRVSVCSYIVLYLKILAVVATTSTNIQHLRQPKKSRYWIISLFSIVAIVAAIIYTKPWHFSGWQILRF